MAISNARLGYDNLLEKGSVAASSQNPSFPVQNAYDWLTCDYFKPAASGTVYVEVSLTAPASADYFAFYGHDLYLRGGTIKLQYYNGTTYVDCFAAITPTDNRPQMVTFTSASSTKWRVVFTCTSVFSIAVISFGAQLPLERGIYLGWTPPRFSRATQIIDSMSDGGQFLGRSIIANGVTGSLVLNYATDAWMRASWLPFVRHAERKPFFFVPDIANYPDEAVFAMMDGNMAAPSQTGFGYMSGTFAIRGMVE